MRDLEGQIALVTGGGKGVGKVVARTLAERGAHVLINCFHSYDRAKQTQTELRALGAEVDVLRASVGRQDQVDRMFDEIEERFGRLDVLVNNAASGWLGPASGITAQHFTRALDVNLLGSFWCAMRAAPLMAGRGGRIVNVSSVGAGMVPDNYLVVGTSKAAVESLTRHLAAQLAPSGIRVNTASCSLVSGEVAELFPRAGEMQRVTMDATPLGRLATAEDLAGVVTFLTSDLSRWVTGQVVLADGGLSLANAMLSPPKDRTGTDAAPPPAAGPSATEPAAAAAAHRPAEPEADLPVPARTAPRAAGATSGSVTDGPEDAIAVVGMGLAVPGASTPEEYWQQVMSGGERFVEVPADRWDKAPFSDPDPSTPDKTYQTRSGFLTTFTPDARLAAEIGAGEVMEEHTALWLRHALHQALAPVRRREADRVLLAVGYTADGNQHLEEAVVLDGTTERLTRLAGDGPDGERLAAAARRALESRLWRGRPGQAGFLPHRVGRAAMRGVLQDHDELLMVDTACSSSLYAVDIGMKSLLLGRTDIAVCGGSFALGPRGAVLFSKLRGLSTGGAVRSLDQDADGVLFSDGAGVVVLKRLSQARADGDQVLGLLAGLGSSSDGKGKAIYAPSSSGQAIAVRRALEAPGVTPEHIDWVVAHATGTPAGDLAEFTTLRTTVPTGHPVHVTSNKSLIGHTGWAAGVVSLVEVLLALQHETIPGQHRFQQAPAAFELEGSSLRISATPVVWPRRPDRPRAASVSGFGFGGTNAHLVVQEHDGRGLALPEVQPDEPLVLVGWSARLPGMSDPAQIRAWLDGSGPAPATSFGPAYPRPPFDKVRIPPGTLRTLDRCQLMILESVFDLGDQLRAFTTEHGDRTAVLAGHMGPTRNATLYALRCYLDDTAAVLSAGDPQAWQDGLDEVFERYAAEIRELVPESNEDSFPGIMPNVIPARVANYLDFHGPNMTLDAGPASALAALQVAMRYLRTGEVDVALVSGINGNSTAEAQAALAGLADGPAPEVAEGVVTFAVVRDSTARQHSLPVLARLDEAEIGAAGSEVGARTRWAGYLGAAGALEVLRTVLAGGDGATVVSGDPDVPAGVRVLPPHAGPSAAAVPAQRSVDLRATVPAALLRADEYAPGCPTGVHRHVVALEAEPLVARRAGGPFAPSGTVVVTDDVAAVQRLDLPADSLVLTTRPAPASAGAVHLPVPSPDVVRAALDAHGAPVAHVRLVASLSGDGEAAGPPADLAPFLALHDLLFLTVQAVQQALADGGSLVTVLLDGLRGGEPHPLSGAVTGFVKSAAIELPGCRTYAVVTSTADPAVGVRQAEAEWTAEHALPVAVHDGDRRLTLTLRAEDAPLRAGDRVRLGPDSVVLATGGSRGITGELLKAVAAQHRPAIWILGSSDLTTTEPLPERAEYVRQRRAAEPGLPVAALNAEYERRQHVATALSTLAELRRLCGDDRVHYLRADVRDAAAVEKAVGAVLAQAGRVDLLLHTAGINRSSSLATKKLEDFRAVRDIKVVGYHNLKRALGNHVPALWCNFSSFIGLTGQVGETDYAAGNDFLTTASRFAARVQGREEFALGWNLWSSVGLGADPVKKAFLEKSGQYTQMGTAEGVHHFFREIDLGDHEPSVVLMGSAEKQALLDYTPTLLAVEPKRPPSAQPQLAPPDPPQTPDTGFFLDRRLPERQPDVVEFERSFDLTRDAYLTEHVVHGHPTLPGTFVTEIAAEAARALDPGRYAVCFEDAVFSSFLRVYGADRPARKKVRATLVSRTEQETVVRVAVLTDVVAPNGTVLAADRQHFAMTVRLRDEFSPAPSWAHWPVAEDRAPMADPYHLPNPAVVLTGSFVSTRDTRRHVLGRRAEYDLHIAADDERFRRFQVPAVLLDGLVRVSVLDPVDDGFLTLAAPASMRRIDLYEPGNDLELVARYPEVSLYSAPGRIDLENGSSNRCVAVAPDGHVVAQIHDTATALLGYVHPETGEFRTPAEMAEARGRTVARPDGAPSRRPHLVGR